MKCIDSANPNGNPDAKQAKGKQNTTGKASDKKTESETGKGSQGREPLRYTAARVGTHSPGPGIIPGGLSDPPRIKGAFRSPP